MNKGKTTTNFIVLLFILVALSACSNNQNKIAMNELAEDNLYHYENKVLGFRIDLPPEFIYYQTQRHDFAEFSDLEILVPTGDPEFVGVVPNHASPLTIRVFNRASWEETVSNDDKMKNTYEKIGEKDEKIYTIYISDNMPSDWKEKWTPEMIDTIKKSFLAL